MRPDEDERVRRILETLTIQPSVNNRPLIPTLGIDLVELGLDPDVVEAYLTTDSMLKQDEVEAEIEQATEEDQQDIEPPTSGAIPSGPAEPASGEPDVDDLAFLERVRTMAAAELDEVLRRAGTQVMNQSRKLPVGAVRAKVDEPAYRSHRHRRAELLQALGAEEWAAIGRTPEGLVAGAFGELQGQLVGMFHGHFARRVDTRTADRQARTAAAAIVGHLDRLALEAFCRPLPREDGLTVPLSVVRDAARSPVPA